MSWHGFTSASDAPKEVEHEGSKYIARPVLGCEVEMRELRDGELAAWGDGSTFHVRMMPINS